MVEEVKQELVVAGTGIIKSFIFSKRAIIALFFFLTSCSSSSPQWIYGKMDSCCQDFRSQKLLQPAKNLYQDISIELVETRSGLRVYLNTHSIPFITDLKNPNLIQVKMRAGDENRLFAAYRLKGGQKALLSQNGSSWLISALLENKEVTLSIDRYSTVASPNDFFHFFEKKYTTERCEHAFTHTCF